jgi:hypothetical protein
VPTASIQINQAAHPSQPTGTPGVARIDLVLGQPVTLVSAQNTDVVRWRWAMRDRPAGSGAALSDLSSSTTTFIPDVAGGSWRVELVVNDGDGAGERQVKICSVPDDFGRRTPAANEVGVEANYSTPSGLNVRGWQPAMEQAINAIGKPQIMATFNEDTLAIAASVTLGRAGVGLPASDADILASEILDISFGANVGPPPVFNGTPATNPSFATITGTDTALGVVTYDLDTSGTSSGDLWALMIKTTTSTIVFCRFDIA